jgi:hypothetical protein
MRRGPWPMGDWGKKYYFFNYFSGFWAWVGGAGRYARAVRCGGRARGSRDGRGGRLGRARGGDGQGSFIAPGPPPFDGGGDHPALDQPVCMPAGQHIEQGPPVHPS